MTCLWNQDAVAVLEVGWCPFLFFHGELKCKRRHEGRTHLERAHPVPYSDGGVVYGNDDNHGRSEGVAWVARVAMESCTCGNPDIREGVACAEALNAYVKALHVWRHSRHT